MSSTITTDRGSHIEHQGRPAVRFERVFAHPVDRVWRCVTEPDELRHWFPCAVSYEPRVGSPIIFEDDPNTSDRTGTVLAWDPPHTFAFEWGDNEIHLELGPTDTGCRLVLIDVLGDPEGAASHAAGWHVCLDELTKATAGQGNGTPHGDHATPWRPLFESYRDEGMPATADLPTQDQAEDEPTD